MGSQAGNKRVLVVTRCDPLSTFTNKRGDEQQIYEVEATDEAGIKVPEKLRSFVELALEQPIEYEVVPYDHQQYGRSYTLKPPSKKSGLAMSVDALRARVDALDRQNRWMYERLVEKGLLPAANSTSSESEDRAEPSPRPPAESSQTAPNSRSESEDRGREDGGRSTHETPAADPEPEKEIPF